MSEPKTIYLKDYQKPPYLCQNIALHFDIMDDHTEVTARLTMQVNMACEGDPGPLVLDGEGLDLKRIELDGETLSQGQYTLSDEALTIPNVPNAFTLETLVHIDPANNTALSGLYQSNGNYCTQCESHGFRRITFCLDRPDVLSFFTVSISADSHRYPNLLSNGHMVERRILQDGRSWVKWHDPFLKPCYLFALVAGSFDIRKTTFVTSTNRQVQIHFYVEKGFVEQIPYAMESLKQAMAWDEMAYGRVYDLDVYMVVAVSDFNFGAMENKGLNIFNTKFVLAHPLTAMDQDYLNVKAVIAHEYFHNWSGNRVTCRDWFQISLKEGFTVFREHGFMAHASAAAWQRIQEVCTMRNHQFAEDKGPMSHPVQPSSYIEINNFYTLTVYQKGGELIRMMSLLLGLDKFRQGTDLYFDQYDGQAVTIEEFVSSMESASGVDLQQFRLWYSTPGTPAVKVSGEYDANNQTYTLHVSQSIPGQKDVALHIPMVVGLLSAQSGDALQVRMDADDQVGVNEALLSLKEPEQSFVFHGLSEAPVPSLFRGFSAPVDVLMPLDAEQLKILFLHDSDPVNQWGAGQTLAAQAIFAYGSEAFNQLAALITDCFNYLLDRSDSDLMLMASLLSLPMESYLIQCHTPCDIDLIVTGRSALQRHLSEALEQKWMSQYHAHLRLTEYEPELPEMARRRFKNLCLAYLAVQEKEEYMDLCAQQYAVTDNLTDHMTAIEGLRDHDVPQREEVLNSFYESSRSQPLVLDRWFQVQAESRLPNTLDVVKGLQSHQDFNWLNPNRVRSLIGSLCMNNHPTFHDASGEAYRFLGEVVTQLDQRNPHTASRLLTPLTHWKRYDADRSAMMRTVLETLAKAKLSKGVFEVVSKSLED